MPNRKRVPFLALGFVSLFAGLWAGLGRLGLPLPGLRPELVLAHGPLMIGGFLGALMGLERAAALGRPWGFAAPILAGFGGIAAIAGFMGTSAVLILLSSTFLFAIFIQLMRQQKSLAMGLMTLAVVFWWVGNLLWVIHEPMFVVVYWWVGFLVLTIAGERLIMSRFTGVGAAATGILVFILGVMIAGLFALGAVPVLGARAIGLALILLPWWLLRHDTVWRSAKHAGQTRFIAICLIAGYVWLAVSGVLLMVNGQVIAGPVYDAVLHAIFLGFIFSMIFGHAPIVFPALLNVTMVFHRSFYVHVVILHASLILRIAGNLTGSLGLRHAGGTLGVVAILLFLISNIVAVRRGGHSSN
jgi:hypothetical protein